MKVATFKDCKDVTAEELLKFRHIASEYEQQIMKNEKMGKFMQQNPTSSTRCYDGILSEDLNIALKFLVFFTPEDFANT